MMQIEPVMFILIVSGAVLITGALVYLVVKQVSTSKSSYEELRNELVTANGKLEFESEIKKTIQNELSDLKQAFEQEREKYEHANELRISSMQQVDSMDKQLSRERELNEQYVKEIEKNSGLIIELNEKMAVYRANLNNLQEKLEKQQADFDLIRKRSLDEFKVAANALLEEKSERFAKFNQEKIEQILRPLGENLSEFKQQVKETYDKESKQRFSLEDRIKQLVDLNNQISKDAKNLTNALKGQAKTQGDWGEMILENILEYSGLTKNREYFVQDTFRDEDGQLKKPDIIVKYPDERYIIIDSKVSLTAYERMTKTEDQDLIEIELLAHIKSIKGHIDELSAKEYDKFDKTLDFVMLFVPIEPAYLVAMQHDPELWNYAYSRRILLISPTNLIAALKMVSDIWKRDDQNKNAREIAKRGEMLYEKFVGFVGDLKNIEKHISKADDSWKEAMSKLSSGRGNLIGQAEKLRKLGLKPKKQLSGAMLLSEEEE